MIALSVTARGEKRLAKLLQGNSKRLRREMAIAVNATSKKTVALWAEKSSKELATAQKNIKGTIRVRKKASAGESKSPTAVVTQKKTGRIPLRDFGARQTKKGVSYRISPGKGKKPVIAGAFQGPKPGVMKASWRGRVFKRVGKERLPIVQLMGPSPWGVFIKKKMTPAQMKEIETELAKQIERRINLNVLRANKLVST